MSNSHSSDNEIKNEFFLKQLNKLLSEISHEIKNPIGTGLTASSHLKKKTGELSNHFNNNTMTKNQLKEYIGLVQESSDIIEENLKRASSLIQNFKELTSIQSKAEKLSFNINKHLNIIKRTISPRLRKANAEVEIIGDENLSISFYPDLLFQIIDNLIINSITHGFSKKNEGHIKIEFSVENTTFTIIYSDNGTGIPQEHRDHIFDEYYTTAQENGGTGLGMHIIHTIITKDLNGTITLDQENETGTTFIINIPI